MTICSFCIEKEVPLHETKHFRIHLADNQAYLGKCMIISKHHRESLSSLTEHEWQEFTRIVPAMEQAIKKTWGATLLNWACLMNHAYQNSDAHPHVHWHLVPRYKKSITIKDTVFDDPEFGWHYDNKKERMLPPQLHELLEEQLQKNAHEALQEQGL